MNKKIWILVELLDLGGVAAIRKVMTQPKPTEWFGS